MSNLVKKLISYFKSLNVRETMYFKHQSVVYLLYLLGLMLNKLYHED